MSDFPIRLIDFGRRANKPFRVFCGARYAELMPIGYRSPHMEMRPGAWWPMQPPGNDNGVPDGNHKEHDPHGNA